MEVRVLRYFLTVAREENITKAAEVLHITQPTLSRQLMLLEKELGVQLFIRGKSKITLTNEGMYLRHRAEEIVYLADKTEKEFAGWGDNIVGEISIGSGETHTFAMLADIIKDFQSKHPQVVYSIYSGNADDIKERIDKGLIDIGFLIEPVDIQKYNFLRTPEKEIWGITTRIDSPLAELAYITPADLQNEPIIQTKRTIVQNEISNWFGDYHKDLKIVATYNLINNAAMLVQAGIGSAITLSKIPWILDQQHLCFRPFFPPLETGTVFIWKKHHTFTPAVTQFLRNVRKSLET